ncbi:MAG TPA: hypothetical protein VKV73_31755 [Chloroflexota bacterium]|nr:hypothetical protein [Chloroflexota bacterium]
MLAPDEIVDITLDVGVGTFNVDVASWRPGRMVSGFVELAPVHELGLVPQLVAITSLARCLHPLELLLVVLDNCDTSSSSKAEF